MRLVVGISIGNPREQILIGLARQQIAIVERVLAELGEQRVAAGIGDDDETAGVDRLGIGVLGCRCDCGERTRSPGCHQGFDQTGRA